MLERSLEYKIIDVGFSGGIDDAEDADSLRLKRDGSFALVLRVRCSKPRVGAIYALPLELVGLHRGEVLIVTESALCDGDFLR